MEELKEKIIYYITINKRKIIITIITLLIFIICLELLYFYNYKNNNLNKNNEVLDKIIKEEKVIVKEETKPTPKTHDIKYLYVDIKGEINKPGVYRLEENKRIYDVIREAGGLTKNASTIVNNLSKKIEDEMVIIIYSKNDINNFKKKKQEEQDILENFKEQQETIHNDSIIQSSQIDTNNNIENNEKEDTKIDIKDDSKEEQNDKTNIKISINTSSKEELLNIKGVGESKAEAIIKYRQENGGFKTIEDIKNVSGIGDSIFNKIKDYITI